MEMRQELEVPLEQHRQHQQKQLPLQEVKLHLLLPLHLKLRQQQPLLQNKQHLL